MTARTYRVIDFFRHIDNVLARLQTANGYRKYTSLRKYTNLRKQHHTDSAAVSRLSGFKGLSPKKYGHYL